MVTNYNDCEIDVPNVTEFQKRTLQICLGLSKEGTEVILVTNNIALQLKAKGLGIKAEKFKDEIFPILEEQYTGRLTIDVSKEIIDKMYNDGKIDIEDVYEFSKELKEKHYENCYIIMKSIWNIVIGKVEGDKIIKVENHNRQPYGIVPKNDGQRVLLNALFDDSPLTIVKGTAGTGKTLLSLAVALEEYENKKYNRILIARDVCNEKLGYLPGDVDEKLSPFLQGIMDNLEILINGGNSSKPSKSVKGEKQDRESGEYYFEKGIIKIQALEMLRGRSIVDVIFIIDEAQNIPPEDVKTIITRAAKGSKFIVLGDPTQVDNPKLSERYNGLVYLCEKMKGQKDCTIVTLQDEESVRSDLAKVALTIL